MPYFMPVHNITRHNGIKQRGDVGVFGFSGNDVGKTTAVEILLKITGHQTFVFCSDELMGNCSFGS